MQRSRIEWTDYTLNPIKGMCPVDCKDNQGKSYCYARRMYKRFKWNPEIRLHIEAFEGLCGVEKPSRIFIGSTIELFGDWIKPEWLEAIFQNCRFFERHTFLFLTKCPENLPREWPENCWVGMTITDKSDLIRGHHYLYEVKAKVKFLSIEPLLGRCQIATNIVALYNLVIIGQQTPVSAKSQPKIEWIKEIVEAADRAGIPVFLKDNLIPLIQPLMRVPNMSWFGNVFGLRQELPAKAD